MPISKRTASVAAIALLVASASHAALAQTAYLEQAGIIGAGKLITLSRVPTTDAAGKIRYTDVMIPFAVNAGGVLSLAAAPTFMMSKKLETNHFVAGRYYVKSGSAATQFGTLSYGVGSGGSTVWTLVMDQAPDAGFPDQATWQTGATAPDVAARLNAAKVPNNPNYSYGTIAVGGPGYPWGGNGLLAAEQVNANLTLYSYTYNGADYSQETGSIVLSLCTDSTCSNAPQ